MTDTKTDIKLKLIGEDGNAMMIVGRGRNALKRAGMGHLADKYSNEALAGDYNNVLMVTMEWFDCDSEDEDEDEDEEECDEDWWAMALANDEIIAEDNVALAEEEEEEDSKD